MEIKEHISLAPYTYINIGGFARYFTEAKTKEDLIEALMWVEQKDIPFYIIGAGSNILVSDKEYPGLVIRMALRDITFHEDDVIVDAGVPMALAAHSSVSKGLIGFEWAVGVPGTIGGSVYGNAGCFGGEMADVVQEVTVINIQTIKQPDNGITILPYAACRFEYRESIFKLHSNLIILSARIHLNKGTKTEIENARSVIKDSSNVRIAEQDIGVKTAGSTFKGIPITDKYINSIRLYRPEWRKEKYTCWVNESRRGMFGAGFFIEQAGLKGMCVGGVMVSKKHANFLINMGNAKAEDVVILIAIIKERVHRMFGVFLEEEIRYVGFGM